MDYHEDRNFTRHYSNLEIIEVRRQKIAKFSILFILILERLAYFALIANLFLFLNEGPWETGQSWDALEALNAVFFFSGISYLSALLGGYISDAFLGRFKAILFGFALYIIGYVLITLISVGKLPQFLCSNNENIFNNNSKNINIMAPCKSMVYLSLSILGIGTGTVKSNIAPFGAEQLRTADRAALRSFFNWFYWCINIGSLLGIGALAFIEQDNPGLCSNGFFCGYAVACGCLILAAITFLCSFPWFYISRCEGSLMFNVVKIVYAAIKSSFRHWNHKRSNPYSSPLQVEPSFLDRAKIRYGGTFHESAVDDVFSLGKLMAVFCALIPYWIVAFQMQTSFQDQALHMRFSNAPDKNSLDLIQMSNVTRHGITELPWAFTVPAAWLTLFNQAFIILAIPVLTSFLYPILDKSGIHLSLFFRIGLGMVFSMLAVLTAGGLETYRTFLWRTDPSSHINQTIGHVTYYGVDISIFWQIPQYVLVGAGEVFSSIAGLEFAYTAAPPTFQGLIMGLFYSLEGCASFLTILILKLIKPFWFNNPKDHSCINENHLDFYLYFLGLIQFLTIIIFCTVIYIRRFSLRIVGVPSPFVRHTDRFRRTRSVSELPITLEDDSGEVLEQSRDSLENSLDGNVVI